MWYDTTMIKVRSVGMNIEMRNALKRELEEFREQTIKFMNKELSVKEFKGYSGGFGSYAQRGGNNFMVRLRMNQGIVTKEKLKFIIDTCDKYHIQKAHITTCQTIQLHDVEGMDVVSILSNALDHDIVCRGGGGDFPRNVMCSPLSGCTSEEAFDVIPYAYAVSDYLMQLIHKFSLPRKLKIAFSNNQKNETHATFRDLGFVANMDHTFDVYCAGGLGNNPKMGVKVGHHVSCVHILYYVSTMVLLFMQYGNYEDRTKARSRYLQDVLGSVGLQAKFQERLQVAFESEHLDVHVVPQKILKTGVGELRDRRVIKQKQTGLYAVQYHPIGGNITPQQLFLLQQLIQPMEEVHLRITPQESIYIVNCTADEARKILSITVDGAQNEFEESVACIGAATCQVGLRDSQGFLQGLIQYLRPFHYDDHVLPRIFISGCPSSCGTNQIGAIGFQGSVKVIDKQVLPAFTISLYGSDTLHQERFGHIEGVILERDIPFFMKEVGDHVKSHNLTYASWIQMYPNQLESILKQYLQ